MAQIIEVERKSDVLKRPSLPCLSEYHTINLAAGCPYECRYCYAQSFRSNPGGGKVRFYANTFERLRHELPRKRRKPELVYFSTACEPFMPYEQVLDQLLLTMELLLSHRISLLISTKSRIHARFIDLFGRHPELVHVQVGLTTVNDDVRCLLEPHAASVGERLRTLQALVANDVGAEARIDPLVPELTDTAESFQSLCKAIRRCGAHQAVTSYLFLRNATYRRLDVVLGDWSFREMTARLYTDRIEGYCGGQAIRIPPADYRNGKYHELKGIARHAGIQLGLCRCKNPDLTGECCHPKPATARRRTRQLTLLGH